MNTLKIYNTLYRKKQKFSSIKKKEVKMYVCGITPYNHCHIGHARMMIVFDIIKKWLNVLKYNVIYVRNITDIDDKIIYYSLKKNKSINTFTNYFINSIHKDEKFLNTEKPNFEPYATNYIYIILSIIKKLKYYGYAYKTNNNDINYSISKFKQYGKLSKRIIKYKNTKYKNNKLIDKNLDFVLWKHSKNKKKSNFIWNSEYGYGRPGWHIECSAMIYKIFGENIDIHGGGQDLQFPHHENEIAQIEAFSKKTYANYWIHNGCVNFNKKKMSKSSQNFFLIKDIKNKYHSEVLRYFIIKTHYRSTLDYNIKNLKDSRNSLKHLYFTLINNPPDFKNIDWNEIHAKKFRSAMNDDFNTPLAISILFKLSKIINITHNTVLSRQLYKLSNILGILKDKPNNFLKHKLSKTKNKLNVKEIINKINERKLAKIKKNYKYADQIRKDLLKIGIILEDKKNGNIEWRYI